jgi:hypothetical protein
MGINAQTSVPKFTIGDVLTAANTNLLTNAPPVFSGTATRDAAFGGAGEKTLAEGQLCYLEDSNIVQYYDGAAWATVGPTVSKILQVVSASSTTAVATTSTSFVTSGLAATITPTLNTSKIYIAATFPYDSSSGSIQCNASLFRGTVAGTNLATGGDPTFGNILAVTGAQLRATYSASFLDSPATTSATTYTVGIKVNGAITMTAMISGNVGTITLFEVAA